MKSADRTRETWRRITKYEHKEHVNANCKEKSPNCAERLSIRQLLMILLTTFFWGGGYYSEKRAVEQALKKCRSSNCHLVATFANACGVIVTPDSGMRTVEDFFVGVDPDDRKAAAKAMQVCEARHGKNQCGYSTVKTRHGTAFCTGYDYSIYGQK